MRTAQYAVIILAAGYSSRMGSFKPLIKLGGVTITERLISNYRAQNIAVYLVVGWQKDELLSVVHRPDINIVENPGYAEGMFSSIKAGLGAIKKQAFQAVFVQPVDVPLVRAYTLKQLMTTYNANPAAILYPGFDRKRGHPPIIAAHLIEGILNWTGKGGLRGFLQTHEDLAKEVGLPDSNILFDIDTPDVVPELEERFRLLEIPSERECDVILNDLQAVDSDIQRHCRAVADLAWEIGQSVHNGGEKVDLKLIRAAARLHDLAKGQARHERAGAKILRELGFPEVANIVASHTELEPDITSKLETKIVFLADKFMRGDKRINLEERYRLAREKFGRSAEALTNINQRQEKAFNIKSEIESGLGYPLEQIVFG
jgi:molybdenum cofactor cytidylyltransferase